jgi:hypothetical protein
MNSYAPTGPSGPHPSLNTPMMSPNQQLIPQTLAAMGIRPPGAPGAPTGAPTGATPGAATGAPQTPMQSAMAGMSAVKPAQVSPPSAPGGGGASGNLDTGQLMALLKMFGGAPQGAAMPALGKLLGG